MPLGLWDLPGASLVTVGAVLGPHHVVQAVSFLSAGLQSGAACRVALMVVECCVLLPWLAPLGFWRFLLKQAALGQSIKYRTAAGHPLQAQPFVVFFISVLLDHPCLLESALVVTDPAYLYQACRGEQKERLLGLVIAACLGVDGTLWDWRQRQ